MRLTATNPAFLQACFTATVPTPDGKAHSAVRVLDQLLVARLDGWEGGAAAAPLADADMQAQCKGALQAAFALARGAERAVATADVPDAQRQQWMQDISDFVTTLVRILRLSTASHAWVLPTQQEAVKVLSQIPLQASMRPLEPGVEAEWSLALHVQHAGGLGALLRFTHHSLLAIANAQPQVARQFLSEGIPESSTREAPSVPFDPSFMSVTPSAAFPSVMLLHRLCAAELPVRAAVLPTIMQGSGFKAVAAPSSMASTAAGEAASVPVLYDSTVDDSSGQPTAPLFSALKASMQLNPPQDMLKRFAGELLFFGAGRDAARYAKLLGVGLALPLLRRAGLVEIVDGSEGEPAAEAGAAAPPAP